MFEDLLYIVFCSLKSNCVFFNGRFSAVFMMVYSGIQFRY